MIESDFVLATPLWLGLLTAISPCPLATNLLALGFLSRRASSPLQTLRAGLLYALGRSAGKELRSRERHRR